MEQKTGSMLTTLLVLFLASGHVRGQLDLRNADDIDSEPIKTLKASPGKLIVCHLSDRSPPKEYNLRSIITRQWLGGRPGHHLSHPGDCEVCGEPDQAACQGPLSRRCSTPKSGYWVVVDKNKKTCTKRGVPCSAPPPFPNAQWSYPCQSGKVPNGLTCGSSCKPGYTGSMTATCLAGTGWRANGNCQQSTTSVVICTGQPAPVNNAMSWSCNGGTSCTAQCKTGYQGTPTAACSEGQWSVSGACTEVTCTGQPAAISNTQGWTCDAASCTAQCKTGYQGNPTATCSMGQWSISGGCTATTCTGQPAPASNALGWSCIGGASCTAQCKTGYQGSAIAICSLGQWSITGGCAETTCTGQPAPEDNALGWSCIGGASCTAQCKTGYQGAAAAICLLGQWSVTGGCTAAQCSGQPSTVSNAVGWACSVPADSGTTCTAQCKTGYQGGATATCTLGQWSVTGGCTEATCTGQPALGSNALGWSCNGGTSCTAQCKTGYQGSATATCSLGQWSVTGACTETTCTGQPAPISNAQGWSCNGGTSCTAQCKSGYQGSPAAVCSLGQWSVSGSCTEAPCTGQPSPVSNATNWACRVPPTSCTASCKAGYEGSLTATCSLGQWSVSGACTGAPCTGQPSPTANAQNCACSVPANSGTSCTGQCKTGYQGSLTATCSLGQWSVTGTCVEVTCTGQPSPLGNAVGWTCSVPASPGTTCAGQCKTGFQGNPSATCSLGQWSVTGGCSAAQCTGQPSTLVNAAGWNCNVPANSGTSCTTTCNSGYEGTPAASCSAGQWTVTGTCTGKQCTGPPTGLMDADPWACPIPANPGTVCTTNCSTGLQGRITATCNLGSWDLQGECTENNCTAPPTAVEGALAWSCPNPAAPGAVCSTNCGSGLQGQITATCSFGSWELQGACTGAACNTQPPAVQNAAAWSCELPTPDTDTCATACSNGDGGAVAVCKGGTWDVTQDCTPRCTLDDTWDPAQCDQAKLVDGTMVIGGICNIVFGTCVQSYNCTVFEGSTAPQWDNFKNNGQCEV